MASHPTSDLPDPAASARAAGLRYVTDEGPGIRRRRSGKGWTYLGPDGKAIRDPAVRRRIDARRSAGCPRAPMAGSCAAWKA